MSVANTNFKVGDRVRYSENGYTDAGVIMPDNAVDGYALTRSYNVWVKWDSTGEILQISARSLTLELSDKLNTDHDSKLTVQSSIDFLISQGYTVSLSKN